MSARIRIRGYIAKPGIDGGLPETPEPPAAWMVNRLGVNDEGQPLQQGIFSNYNDDILLEADSQTLVGRYDPARGPAQRIGIGKGLRLQNGVLISDSAQVLISDTAPVGSPANALWWCSLNGTMYINFADADSTQWVAAMPQPTQGPQGVQGPPGQWTQITQAQYNALSPPNPTTLYVIIG